MHPFLFHLHHTDNVRVVYKIILFSSHLRRAELRQALVELQLCLDQLRQRHDHQQILHIRVEHVGEVLVRHVWNGMNEIQQRTTDSIVRLNLLTQHVLDVLQHLIQQLEQLATGIGNLREIHQRFDRLRTCANCLHGELECGDFGLVADRLDFDWREHAAGLAVGDLKWLIIS